MILVTTEDFTGFYLLALADKTRPVLEQFIEDYEKKYILKLLGKELGELLIADIEGEDSDSQAIEDRFQVLINPFTEQSSCKIYESEGLKKLLVALIYYHYVTETQTEHTQAGVTVPQSENSNILSPEGATRTAEKRWNKALDFIEAIQWYCQDFKPSDYPEYDGLKFYARYSPLL